MIIVWIAVVLVLLALLWRFMPGKTGMFHSFFPKPRLLLFSAFVWAIACVVLWFTVADELGSRFSLGHVLGVEYPAALAEGADEAAATAHAETTKAADDMWFYQYMALAYILFVVFWLIFSPHKWSRWSVAGSALIIFVIWFQVQIDVLINHWFGEFYDMIQVALSEPGVQNVAASDYYASWIVFAKLALVSITVSVLNSFFVSHYVFRWRTAMNDHYMGLWHKVRHIEGASQRIQEDTMRFAVIVESLGVRFVDSIMTLIAFLPILWGFSGLVKELPIIGAVPHALFWVAIIWSILGTGILAVAGLRLPGLEFRNQRVEAAYRKELVLGEDHENRAQPPTVLELFGNIRKNYFKLYFNYLYFNVFRYAYLQVGVFVPYLALAPTIIAAGFTLGVMRQVIRAFGRVEGSFQFLVNSWTTIVELLSIHKRLVSFEAAIEGRALPGIDQEWQAQQGA